MEHQPIHNYSVRSYMPGDRDSRCLPILPVMGHYSRVRRVRIPKGKYKVKDEFYCETVKVRVRWQWDRDKLCCIERGNMLRTNYYKKLRRVVDLRNYCWFYSYRLDSFGQQEDAR